MVNSGMAGVAEMTSALLRLNRPFWVVTSHIDDLSGRRKLAEYIQAVGILARLKKTRIAIAGHPFEGMTDLMVDQLSLRKDVGPVCWPLEPEKFSIVIKPRPVAAPQMLFRPKQLGIADWCNAWLKAGVPHHMAHAYGHLADRLHTLAMLGNWDFIGV